MRTALWRGYGRCASDLIDPTVAAHNGRVFKRTGDGALIEFRSVVDAVRCAIAVQNSMAERFSAVPPERRIVFRIGIHLGDVVEESDGDLMGDGVNIAARLEGIAAPGAICLSEDAYRQVKARLDLAVTDLGPTQLKNIAEPIRAYSLEVGKPAQAKPAPAPAPEKSAPPRLSIVVLPFANIGGGPEQEHFVDGVTESLTTDLSRIRGAFVIGRNTAFTYKGKAVDLKQIGRELNVRYVLEGSVQRGGNRMRVNVQLIDAETGNHLWAERFDKPLADLFDMQDEIVARLAGALNAQLVAAEARRAERTPNPNSMDLYFQGMAWLNKGLTPNHVAQARSFFDRALSADPDNVDALIGLAGADVLAGSYLFVSYAFPRSSPQDEGRRRPYQSVVLGVRCFGLVCVMTTFWIWTAFIRPKPKLPPRAMAGRQSPKSNLHNHRSILKYPLLKGWMNFVVDFHPPGPYMEPVQVKYRNLSKAKGIPSPIAVEISSLSPCLAVFHPSPVVIFSFEARCEGSIRKIPPWVLE